MLPSRSISVAGTYVYQAPFYDNATIFESASAAASRPYGYLRAAANAPATIIQSIGPLFGSATAIASVDELFNYSHTPGINYWAKLRVLGRGSLSINAIGYGSATGVFTEEFQRLDSDSIVIEYGSVSLTFPHDSLPTGSAASDIAPGQNERPTVNDRMRAVFGPLDIGYGYIDLYIPITDSSRLMYMRSRLFAVATAGRADFSHTAMFSMEVPSNESWGSQSGQFLTAAIPEPDTTPPVLTLPASLAVDATSPQGTIVNYTVTATDNSGVAPTVSCSPLSGATFAIGPTTVNCAAIDAANNSSTGSFIVTVNGAVAQLSNLIALVETVSNPFGTTNSLGAKLRNAMNGDGSACDSLGAFIKEAQAQSGKKLPVVHANLLIESANQIRAVLGCP